MPENPLLPHAQLRALHALLKRATEQPSPRPPKAGLGEAERAPRSQEALLAGTLVQLSAGDILVTGADSPAPDLILSEDKRASGPSVLRCSGESPQLALAAGLAEGLRRVGSDRVVLAVLSAGLNETGWADTLAWVQESTLPLILACADPSGAEAFRTAPVSSTSARSGPMNWSSLGKVAGSLKLPVLSVDGEDAVAVYRVMQESALRARSGGGPAILWAMLPSDAEIGTKRPRSSQPLRRLEHYLKTRQISL